MTTSREAEVKIVADPAFIADLAQEWSDVEGVQTSDVRDETETSELAFDLGIVASIVTLIQAAVSTGPVFHKFWQAFSRQKPSEVVVKTPFKSLRLQWTGDWTEDELRAVLTQLLDDGDPA